MQAAPIPSLVRELDPTCHNWGPAKSNKWVFKNKRKHRMKFPGWKDPLESPTSHISIIGHQQLWVPEEEHGVTSKRVQDQWLQISQQPACFSEAKHWARVSKCDFQLLIVSAAKLSVNFRGRKKTFRHSGYRSWGNAWERQRKSWPRATWTGLSADRLSFWLTPYVQLWLWSTWKLWMGHWTVQFSVSKMAYTFNTEINGEKKQPAHIIQSFTVKSW